MKAEMNFVRLFYLFLGLFDLVLLSRMRHTPIDNRPTHILLECIHTPSTGVSKQGVCYTN